MGSEIIKPIEDRTDIAAVAQRQFFVTGNAIEVGVWQGEFAAQNLKHWRGRYYLCDKWAFRQDGTTDKNMNDSGSWGDVIREAVKNTLFAGSRVKILHGDSEEMAKEITPGHFDWIYIDTKHDYLSVKKELHIWWPKLRSGGMFSGDDYGDKSRRWANRFGGVAKIYNWGVIHAVNEFCQQNNLQLNVTWMNDITTTPAWYLVKP